MIQSNLLLTLVPVSVQQGDVNAPAEVVGFECDVVGLMEEVRVKDDRAIGAIGNADRLSA